MSNKLKFKVGDPVRVVTAQGAYKEYIGKEFIIEKVNPEHEYPYELKGESRFLWRASQLELITPKEKTIEERMERIEKWIDFWETIDTGWNSFSYPKIPPETIEIQGKKYILSEVAEKLKELKEVE